MDKMDTSNPIKQLENCSKMLSAIHEAIRGNDQSKLERYFFLASNLSSTIENSTQALLSQSEQATQALLLGSEQAKKDWEDKIAAIKEEAQTKITTARHLQEKAESEAASLRSQLQEALVQRPSSVEHNTQTFSERDHNHQQQSEQQHNDAPAQRVTFTIPITPASRNDNEKHRNKRKLEITPSKPTGNTSRSKRILSSPLENEAVKPRPLMPPGVRALVPPTYCDEFQSLWRHFRCVGSGWNPTITDTFKRALNQRLESWNKGNEEAISRIDRHVRRGGGCLMADFKNAAQRSEGEEHNWETCAYCQGKADKICVTVVASDPATTLISPTIKYDILLNQFWKDGEEPS